MDVEWELDEERRLLTVRLQGDFPNLRENFEFLDGLIRQKKISPSIRALVDLTDVRGAPNYDEARMFVASLATRRDNVPARRAYVVSTDFLYGVKSMTAAIAEQAGFQARVFRNERDALDWLLDED